MSQQWQRYLSALREAELFRGLDGEPLARLLDCVGACLTTVPAGGILALQGDAHHDIVVIAKGHAVGQRLQANGSVVTVNDFFEGDVFGDVLSGSSQNSMVTVTAETDCTAVRFAFDSILSCCADSREQQIVLLRNLINIISDKYFALFSRVAVLAQGTLRAKVAGYLLQRAAKVRAQSFGVTHNREEMARYLGCERSALSRELSGMKRDGLIDYRKSRFTICDRQALEELAQ